MWVSSVERINFNRWHTWVCVTFTKEYDINNAEEVSEVSKEIVSLLNELAKTDENFRNVHLAKGYTEAYSICECGNEPENKLKEHWEVM